MSLTYESSSEIYGKEETTFIRVRINKSQIFIKPLLQMIKHDESHTINTLGYCFHKGPYTNVPRRCSQQIPVLKILIHSELVLTRKTASKLKAVIIKILIHSDCTFRIDQCLSRRSYNLSLSYLCKKYLLWELIHKQDDYVYI